MNEDLQQQLVKELVVESLEGLDTFDQEILAFEHGDETPDTWNNAFRIIHTIKGSSGCIGFPKVESVAHVGESLLSVLRDGHRPADSNIASSLLQYSDALREMMRSIEQTGNEGAADHADLVQNLQALQAGISGAAAPEKPTFGFFGDENTEANQPVTPPASAPQPGAVVKEAPKPSAADSAIRVDVGQIDRLMNLVGELVLARNQIVQATGHLGDPGLLTAVQRVNLITSELQESVMKTRMQPIGNVWSKFPRIIRDLCHELGKDVALVMEGNETELDRTIIEAIKDPMTHLIRNAIDHGIETPDARIAAGKPAQGRLVCAPSTKAARSTSKFPTMAKASMLPSWSKKRCSAAS